jgi:hypothetical protein
MLCRFRQLVVIAVLVVSGPAVVSAATVEYSGTLFSFFGTPQFGGSVRAGTFSAGNTAESWILANSDAFDNVSEHVYTAGVSSGVIVPIGPGATNQFDGTFVGLGATSAPEGSQIWLFGFESMSTSTLTQVWATGTDPSWFVPAQPDGFTTINTSTATIFKFGNDFADGIQLGIVPFPEPTSGCLAACGALAMLAGRRSRVSV